MTQSIRGSTVTNTIRPIVPRHETMRSRMGLLSLGASTNSQSHLSPIVEVPLNGAPIKEVAGTEFGFHTVAHKKHQSQKQALPERQAASVLLVPSTRICEHLSTGRTQLGASPPSAAAASRASNYSKQPSPQQRERSQSNVVGNNSGLITMPKWNFKPGLIFRAVLHEEDFLGTSRPSEITMADDNRSETKYGPVYTKQRKMIVVAIHQDHYVAVPLYTHNGKGLSHKIKPDEFISVKDHRNLGDFAKLSMHTPLVTKFIHPWIRPIDQKSVAHLAYPVSRKYTLPVILEGYLDEDSVQHLLSLYQNFAAHADRR